MSTVIAITGWDAAPWCERLQRALGGTKPHMLGEDFDPASIKYAVVWKPPHGFLASLPNLEAIFSLGAGVDHVLTDPTVPDVPLVRVVDTDLTNQMSEWVVLQTLFHLRNMTAYLSQQREVIWRPLPNQPTADEVRVGVMGVGQLGRDALRKLKVLGFDVAGWSRSPKTLEGIPTFHGSDGLDAFLARTDIVISLLPLTPDTRGILNMSLFTKLARDGKLGGPVLINAGRGGLQVEADIIAALDNGTLKGVSLDVFETEPLPATSALWRHPHAVLTPHNAAVSRPEMIARYVADQIASLENGGGLINVVDRKTGY